MTDKAPEHPPFLMRSVMWAAQPFMEVGAGLSYLHNLLSHPGSIASAACLVFGLLVGGCTIYTGGRVVTPDPKIVLPATVDAQPGRLTEIDAITNGKTITWETTATDYDVVTSTTLPKAAFVFPVKGHYLVTARTAIGSKIATAQCQVTVGDVPPDPGPNPPVPPVPPLPPAPIPEPGFRVLIVLKTDDLSKLPPAQAIAIQSKDVTDYLNSKCAVGTDGKQKEWRIWDSTTDPTGESPIWQAAFKRTAGKSLPWILISNGKTGTEEVLPADTASLLTLLKKYGE